MPVQVYHKVTDTQTSDVYEDLSTQETTSICMCNRSWLDKKVNSGGLIKQRYLVERYYKEVTRERIKKVDDIDPICIEWDAMCEVAEMIRTGQAVIIENFNGKRYAKTKGGE